MPAVRALELDAYGNVTGGAPSNAAAKANHGSYLSGGRARGLHDPAETYFAMDVVAFNGSEWRAIKDDPGPLPGPGWMLGAKGSRGKPGERGKDGVDVNGLAVVGYCLVLELSNGQTLRANMLPMLEHFKKESGT